jgi:UDP-glucose 4-epimerase
MSATDFKERRALISGGAGFIGSTLARALVAQGAAVTVLDNLASGGGGNPYNLAGLEDRLQMHVRDLCDEASTRELVQGQDVIFNLAGQSSHLGSMELPAADLDANCRAHLCLLEACRRHNPAVKVVFTSTRQVYGKPDRLPVDESHPCRPVDVNGIHKLAAEGYHLLYGKAYGLRTCVLRLTNTVGPRMRIRDARQMFLGVWVRALLEGRPFEVWGGEQLRDFTDVGDAVQALLLAAADEASDGRVFNVGGDGAVPLARLAEMLVEVHGQGSYQVRAFPADRKRIDIGDYCADCGLIRRTLGWRPQVPLPEALRRTLAFYRENLCHYLSEGGRLCHAA